MNDTNRKNRSEKDHLWSQIKEMPYFRGLLRAVEVRMYEDLELPEPILDLGCGDGHFASVAFDKKINVGIDPWKGPVKLAKKQGSYQLVINGLGNQMPLPDEYFNCVISNSVLEHIINLDDVMREVFRVLKPGGKFIFCVPNHQFLSNLSISNGLDKVGLKLLGNWYRKFFNWISRHYHCDSPEVWEERLNRAGLTIDNYWHYFSPQAFHTLEWGHYLGLPSLVSHFFFRRWILIPQKWNLLITEKITRKFYMEELNQPDGSYSFYIAHK